jgi:hypothetical protein
VEEDGFAAALFHFERCGRPANGSDRDGGRASLGVASGHQTVIRGTLAVPSLNARRSPFGQ